MKTTNRTILDLNKVQHASFWYVNQYGQIKTPQIKPCPFSIRMTPVSDLELAMYHPDYPNETELQREIRLGLMDIWTPVVSFQLTANHNIVYTGPKAVSMWKAWNEKIFNKKGKK